VEYAWRVWTDKQETRLISQGQLGASQQLHKSSTNARGSTHLTYLCPHSWNLGN
jgi:hypothetical protein